MIHNDVGVVQLPRPATTSADLVPLEDRFRRSLPGGATFRNPILPAQSADPWVTYHEGWYYYCESRHQNSIWIRKARSFTEIGQDEGMLVWSAPTVGPDSKSLWAPELHLIDGKWYIYYAADNGHNHLKIQMIQS